MIPLFRPCYDAQETLAVGRVLESRWSGLGPETEAFEKEFAAYAGVRYAIGTNSCTSSLMLSLMSMGVGLGDSVIVPAMSFVSTAHAVSLLGAQPTFCDVDEESLMIDWDDATRRITTNTKAIIAVNYGGAKDVKPPFTAIDGIPVVWDCAHAGGIAPQYSYAHLACWSFHAVKNISCGDGGMVTTDIEELANSIRQLRWLGIDKSTWDRTEQKEHPKYAWEYNCNAVGVKGYLNDIAAAIGRVQLLKLQGMQQTRREVAEVYMEEFCSGKCPIRLPDIEEHGLHLFPIRVPRRNELIEFLKTNGVQAGVHYRPQHLFDCYRIPHELPVVEREWLKLVSLPMHACMTTVDAAHVAEKVKEFYR